MQCYIIFVIFDRSLPIDWWFYPTFSLDIFEPLQSQTSHKRHKAPNAQYHVQLSVEENNAPSIPLYFLVVKSVSSDEEPLLSPRLHVHESTDMVLDVLQIMD